MLMMDSAPNLAERLHRFLYRQHIRHMGAEGVETAREWCMTIIRREHPHLTDEQRDRFYENLINVKVSVVDEWTRRMS